MKTHTIRPTQIQFGFVIDDEMIISMNFQFGHYGGSYFIKVIHLNKGPKSCEDFKNFYLGIVTEEKLHDGDNQLQITNGHICIILSFAQKTSGYLTAYIRGFISNFRESDLENIDVSTKKKLTSASSRNISYMRQKSSERDIYTYLQSIFGTSGILEHVSQQLIEEYCGIQLFCERIYVDAENKKFAVNLSDVKLKDEFDELIKSNNDKIKKFLFPNTIPSEGNYSVY